MKFSGELSVKAPRAAVYKKVRDARFFASCVEGVNDLKETAPDTYSAVFETKVAYMKFKFNVTVTVVRAEEPEKIEAKVEGTPLGIVGRLTATSLTTLSEAGDETKIAYEVDAALTGKLGSLGQPVLRSKAKEMERQFAARLAAAFAERGDANAMRQPARAIPILSCPAQAGHPVAPAFQSYPQRQWLLDHSPPRMMTPSVT